MAWSLAAIEFVAWSVLEEEGAGEEVAAGAFEVAYRANPFVAWNVAHRDVFDEVTGHNAALKLARLHACSSSVYVCRYVRQRPSFYGVAENTSLSLLREREQKSNVCIFFFTRKHAVVLLSVVDECT